MCFSLELETQLKKLTLIGNQYHDATFHPRLHTQTENFEFKKNIYPNDYAPVLIQSQKNPDPFYFPMRYRLRPFFSEKEVPSKYNLFNARFDQLFKRQSWKHLIGKKHGLIIFKSFYEWIEDESKKKKLIKFQHKDNKSLWAPCLWDRWTDGKTEIYSFALITTDPSDFILEAGHDRSPLFLNPSEWENWLKAPYQNLSQKKLSNLLNQNISVDLKYTEP